MQTLHSWIRRRRVVTFLNLSTILNSGLPPAVIFIFKIASIGAITYWQATNYNIFSLFTAAVVITTSLFAYGAYFKLLKSINYSEKNQVPVLYSGLTNKNHEKYMWAFTLTALNAIIFGFVIFLL